MREKGDNKKEINYYLCNTIQVNANISRIKKGIMRNFAFKISIDLTEKM